MARGLMNQHGLGGWMLTFDRAKRRAGCCHYADRKISLSDPLTELRSEAEVRNTVLHEIAHALTPGHGHGPVWRKTALAIGCDGNRCYTSTEKPPYNWIGKCPQGHKFPRYRRKANVYCNRCHGLYGADRAGITWYPADQEAK